MDKYESKYFVSNTKQTQPLGLGSRYDVSFPAPQLVFVRPNLAAGHSQQDCLAAA